MNKCGPIRDWIPKDPCGNNQRGPTLFAWTMSLVRSLQLTAVSCEKESWQCGGGWAMHRAWRWSQRDKRWSKTEKLGSGYNIYATGSSTAWIISGLFRSVTQELPSSLPFFCLIWFEWGFFSFIYNQNIHKLLMTAKQVLRSFNLFQFIAWECSLQVSTICVKQISINIF